MYATPVLADGRIYLRAGAVLLWQQAVGGPQIDFATSRAAWRAASGSMAWSAWVKM